MIHSNAARIAVFVGALTAPSTGLAQDVEWDLALFGSPAFRVAGEAFAEYVTQNSGGDFVITVHSEGLSPAREVLDNLSIGAFELGYVVSSYHPGKNPLMSVMDLPFLPIKSMEQRVAVSEAVYQHEAVVKEFARWSAVPVMTVVQPNYEIMGKGDAPEALEGFDGKRIKATSGIGDALAIYGARLVSVTGAEQYNALQTGVIDAVAATPSALGGFRLYELSDWYTTGMDAGSAHVTLAANLDAFNSLSDEHKALLMEAKAFAYEKTFEAQNAAAELYRPKLTEYELQEIIFDESTVQRLRDEAAKPVWNAFIEAVDEKGLPGQEIFDLVISEAETAGS